MSDTLRQAIATIKAGDKESGRHLLSQVLQSDPDNEQAWLWLSSVAESGEERYNCLSRVLAINPQNKWAKRGLAAMDKKPDAAQPAEVASPVEVKPPEKITQLSPLPTATLISQPPQLDQVKQDTLVRLPQPVAGPPGETEETVVLEKEATLTELEESEVITTSIPSTQSGTYDVFISYSRRDKLFVQKLYETLVANEREAWVDWGNIPLSADWRQEIREGIERANAVIFVMSPEFLASKECQIELELAEEFNKRLIPAVYRDVPPNEVPQSLASLNWLFFRHDDDFDNAFLSLIEAVDTDLDWVKMHTRLLVRAVEWDDQNRNDSFLLRGHDLKDAELQVAQAEKNPNPTPLQKQYILESRQNATKRQRLMLGAVTFGLIISVLLAILAFFQYRRANAAQLVAEAQRDRAELQASIALSRLLEAQAILHSDDQPDMAALLSLEANRVVDDTHASERLLANLRHSPYLVTSLHGHTANVRSVDFSPDGSILASGGKDRTIILWDMATNQPLGPPLAGHTDRVTQVAFSPDGETLASSSRDGTIRLWHVASQQLLGEPLTGHTGRVNSVAFSPDGTTLVSGGSDKTVRLWDVATGQPIGKPLSRHAYQVNSVAFSPDGKVLASGSNDNAVILWDVETGRPLGPALSGHTGWVNSLAFSPDGKFLASGSADRTIRLWDVAKGRLHGVPFTGHPTSVTALAFSADGYLLASGSEDDSVILWEVATGQQLGWPLVGHANSVLGVAFSPDGKTLASASSDSNIVLWDISAGQFLVGHTSVVRSVAFSPDGQLIASGSSDRTVRLWDATTLQQIGEPLDNHRDTVWGVAFSPDGQILASGSDDETIILWDVATGRPRGEPLTAHQGGVRSVAFSPDGQTLASGSADETIILWDLEHSRMLAVLEGHTGNVNAVAFSPDGQRLASASSDDTVIVWDVTTGEPLGEPLTGHEDDVNSVSFSPDGQLLASGSHDNLIILWDVSAGEEVTQFHGHINRVTSVAFSPDGQTLASGSYDKNIILWDVEAGRPHGPPLIGHTNDVNSVAWRPDGQALVSGSWDDTIILWKIQFEPWQERACRIANRNLDEEEWDEFVGPDLAYDTLCADF